MVSARAFVGWYNGLPENREVSTLGGAPLLLPAGVRSIPEVLESKVKAVRSKLRRCETSMTEAGQLRRAVGLGERGWGRVDCLRVGQPEGPAGPDLRCLQMRLA